MEKKENWGGSRPRSGRKRKVEEIDKIKVFDEAITPKQWNAMLKKLMSKAVKNGDLKSAQFLWESRFGKAHQGFDHTTNGKDMNGKGFGDFLKEVSTQLIFANTTLSEADLQEIREIEQGVKISFGSIPVIENKEIK
ncbi:MAG: hypothetical protein ACYCZO_12085 [Daejeonella sp.]